MVPDRRTIPILAVVAICTLPHFLNVAPWVVVACLLLWSYTLAAVRRNWTLPGRLSRGTLAGILSVLTMTTHEGFTIEAFVALLALMISLKLLENTSTRDRMITVILCYFLLVGGLFFDDSIIATAYMMFAVLCTTAVMIHINQGKRGLLAPLKLSVRLMIQAVPIMLIMFLLFPRIQGGLWGRTPVNSGRTGFSNEISFGAIARLAENHEVAFRIEFNGEAPAREQLYWRGIVLSEFDGSTWRRGNDRVKTVPSLQETRQQITYTLTLEPHNEHWLITLDLPMRVSFRRAWLLGDHTLYSWRRISQRISYVGESSLNAKTFEQEREWKKGLQLPEEGNPRTRELAASWTRETEDPEEIMQMALTYFQEQAFVYTLNPGTLDIGTKGETTGTKDLMDRFLFDSRKGFCEHYACSFAFLMRAAGIPARIVAGYQGGTVNRYGGYLVVRQSDAHAWCEVWLPAQGWVRVDPTAAVAPERLQSNATNALPAGEMISAWSFFRAGPLADWLEPMASAWDLLNSRWNRWVMGYSVAEQLDLFSRLGFHLNGQKNLAKRLGIFLAAALPLLLLAGFLISR
ncbi:MAG: DUF3488 domain-containing protein, partial [Proteobacteria bacterium]|nr:DUF3488 domain-containing protein [Pseudomonadota bacterium]